MKIVPEYKEFKKLAKKGNLVPLYAQLLADLDTPLSSFLKLGDSRYSFLLESVEGGEKVGRYSFLGYDPGLIFESKGKKITLRTKNKTKTFVTDKDPLWEMKQILGKFTYVSRSDLPRFTGGFVGYLGYDMVRFFEDIPDSNRDDQGFPDAMFMLTDTLIVFDRVDHNIKIVADAHISGDPKAAYDKAAGRIRRIYKCLTKEKPLSRKRKDTRQTIAAPKTNLTYKIYQEKIKKIKRYIRQGDIIQAVFSQRFSLKMPCPAIDVYRAIRSINPSPYMYYLKFDDRYIVGSSPEILVRCEDGRVVLRPIAGTRPRGKNTGEDRRLEKDLRADPKEKAEHIMLVDLGRNDLGRVCRYKTIKINQLMTLERYSHVMHLVSDIEGVLKSGKDQFDVIRATFPAGTVSGAPKIRAMEIIDELEGVRRGPYAGSVGYFSYSGNVDACITIRTLIVDGKKGYIQAGGGIVADSKPKLEYQESINKAKAMLKAVETAAKGLST